MNPKQIVIIVVLVLVLVVMLQNYQSVTFRFLHWRAEVSQLVLVAVTLLIGFVAGFITAKIWARPRGEGD